MNGPKIVEAARRMVGTPFAHQGRVPGVRGGLDCVGLAVCAGREVGHEVADWLGYARSPDRTSLRAYVAKTCDPVVGRPVPGDVLLFWLDQKGVEQHLAIATESGIIHARSRPAGKGRVIEQDWTEFWRERHSSTWRLR